MSYRALLFCPDEKTARTVTQVLTELDFTVEPCGEAFAAVKKLTSEHFDALVVDGENQQNATLLFKTARNSGTNQNSLAVAIVEGQSGVAKAFQIGANLVLTKPINVEQSKGTLRVARGLLRKGEAGKGTSASTSSAFDSGFTSAVPKPVQVPASLTTPPAGPAAATPTALFETDEDPAPSLAPTEAALLDSMPEAAVTTRPTAPIAKPSPWQPAQPMAKPVATALKQADEALTPSRGSDQGHSVFSHSSSGSAAAAAPARDMDFEEEISAPKSPAIPHPAARPAPTRTNSTPLIAAVVLIALAGAGYYSWSKFHASSVAAPHVRNTPAPPAGATPATTLPQTASTTPATEITPTNIAKPSAGTNVTNAPSAHSTQQIASSEPPSATTKKSLPTIAVSEPAKSAPTAPEPEVLVVNNTPSKSATGKAATSEPVAAPEASIVSSTSDSNAVSGLVAMPTSAPQVAPHTLKVSQGVSQGLLIKKVAPVYPQRAMSMRIQGAVQLLATIGADGSVTDVKLLNGDMMLSRAAMDAVKQWKYKPYYLDDKPLEIQTQITVNFKLP